MPGQLRADARCPRCGDPLEALVDTSNSEGVKREYHHAKPGHGVYGRRRRRCRFFFSDHKQARVERFALEVHAKAAKQPAAWRKRRETRGDGPPFDRDQPAGWKLPEGWRMKRYHERWHSDEFFCDAEGLKVQKSGRRWMLIRNYHDTGHRFDTARQAVEHAQDARFGG